MKDSLNFDKVMQLWLCALDLLLSSSNKMCRVLAALSVVQKFCLPLTRRGKVLLALLTCGTMYTEVIWHNCAMQLGCHVGF